MNKPIYIIDASVILKWFFHENEPFRREALTLRSDYLHKQIELEVPEYCFSEVLNLMGRVLHRERALAYFSHLLLFHITEHTTTLELASRTFKLMRELPRVSFYDAGYHALAFLENGIFVTADDIYASKAKRKGNIIHLKDYGRKR